MGMKLFLICFFSGTLIILFLVLGEFLVSKLNKTNRFKKWWRKSIVAPDPYEITPEDLIN
jgi:hypothetical protein